MTESADSKNSLHQDGVLYLESRSVVVLIPDNVYQRPRPTRPFSAIDSYTAITYNMARQLSVSVPYK